MYNDWASKANAILLNPRFSLTEQRGILDMLSQSPPLQGHIWIATSGSQHIKWTALSKQALLASATAVNSILNSDHSDVWLNALPPFHVGGLGIQARSYLSKAKIIDAYTGKWDPLQFYTRLIQSKITLSALVPAQIYDLINLNLKPPKSLRAVVIGGGALHESIYFKGVELGWHMLPSYGLTEASSQVATAEDILSGKNFPRLKILPHVQAKIDPEGRIQLKSPSLLTLYAMKTENGVLFIDPKNEGWFTTEDHGELAGEYLNVKGRKSDFLKIGGENVNLSRLERLLEEIKSTQSILIETILIPMQDNRLGHVIHLVTSSNDSSVNSIANEFNQRVLPFERIRKIHHVDSIPRSPTLKVQVQQLLKLLQE